MIRPQTFAIVAIASHVWFGAMLVFGSLLFTSTKTSTIISITYSIVIAIKEIFVDPVIETKEEAGSGFQDWATGMAGCVIAWTMFYFIK